MSNLYQNLALSIERLLRAQAERSPRVVAIAAPGRTPLGYGELWVQLTETAKSLNAVGVGPHDRIALVLPNGPEMAAGFLSVSSYAICAPLNPAYQLEEFDFYLSDIKADALIVESGSGSAAAIAAQRQSIPVIELTPTAYGPAGMFSLNITAVRRKPAEDVSEAEGTALILHTSGTTSRPKRIALTHAQLLASAANVAAGLRLSDRDCCLNVMPLFHVHGLVGALLSSIVAGSSVICAPDFDAEKFFGWLDQYRPSWYTAVPTIHQAVLTFAKDNPDRIKHHPLRLIRSCSAPLPAGLAREMEQIFGVPVIEAYGMTEAAHQIASNPLPPKKRKIGSVGLPTGTEIAVINDESQFLSPGEVGELVIRGKTVIRDYTNDRKTSTRNFVGEWFKTGDQGYIDTNGYVYLTGRLKEIINRGGEKILPYEVETALQEHLAVAEAVVFPVAHETLGEEVAAAVVPKDGVSTTPRELQRFLSGKLSEFKIPRRVEIIDQVPKGPTGKLQRSGLADQLGLGVGGLGNCETRPAFVPPRSAIEVEVATIWEEILRIKCIGLHDNFFDLGGQSLLATQIMSRIGQALKVELPLRALFEGPTVTELAKCVEEAQGEQKTPAPPPIVVVSRDKHLPLSFSQQRLWFLDQYEPGTSVYNIPTALRLRGSLNIEALGQSLNEIICRHESLRTTFSMADEEPVQIIASSLSISLDVVDLTEHSESEREEQAHRFVDEEARQPFDLVRGPLFRSKLLRLGDDDHVLLLTMHHIVSDGWSMGVLYRELSTLYRAFVNGQPSPLAELPIQYADFAVWQRQWFQGEVLERQLSYWQMQLQNITALELPTDRPRPAIESHRGGWQSVVLTKDLSEGLKALSRNQGVTLFMTLLAAFQTLLYRYTGQNDIVVGSPIAGRNRSETESLIGFFVNTLLLRTDLSGNVTFKELLDRVRLVTLGAFTHQDLPFEKLVEVLRPKRELSRASLVQVAFAFQNVPREPLEMDNVAVGPTLADPETAKIDLTLFMWEAEQTLVGSFNYAIDLFDESTIRKMAEDFSTLLQAAADNPELKVDELPPFTQHPSAVNQASRRASLDIYEASNLTKNQVLIWTGQKLQPQAPIYNVALTFALSGEVDRNHFQKAFRTLVNSSDALRTVIYESAGVPQQKVRTNFNYKVEYLDFSKASEPAAALQNWAQARCQVLFNLEECLFESVLIKTAEREFVWYLNQHHLITDGWSIRLISRWMAELYKRSVEALLKDKIDLPLFQDYVAHERHGRRSPRNLKAETYWNQKLAEQFEPPSFYGQTCLKRTTRVRRMPCDLGTERTQKLKRLALREDIRAMTEQSSIFNVFAALLFAYLYRITGNSHQSIGTPYHNRTAKAFKSTIGLLMEVLPIRVKLSDDETFLSLIAKIRSESFEVFQLSHAIGNSPKNKIYDVMLNYRPPWFPAFLGKPVTAQWVHAGHENDSLALQVRHSVITGSFLLDFDFHCDVFDEDQSRRAMEHFLQLLDAFLEDPDQPLHRGRLLTKGEEERILVEFTGTELSVPHGQVLPQLFEAQARRIPDWPAVMFEEQSLTYAQLNSKANQLAHHLKSLGVGPETLVAMCVEPSLDLVIGILGILKAGGACVPLDPAYPKERLTFILEDTRAAVLLSQAKLLEKYPDVAGIVKPDGDNRLNLKGEILQTVLLDLDAHSQAVAGQSAANPQSAIAPDNLAYVIYTSGSTGRPKAVMSQHRGLCNRLLWGGSFYGLEGTDRVLQKSSFAYDASIWEIFEPLLAGAQVVLARPGGRQDSGYLVQLMANHDVTVAEFVPSMLGVLLEEKGIRNCRNLKRIFAGGEPLTLDLQKRFFERLGAELYNTYGPTEASIDVTHWHCERDGKHETVPIGRAMANIKTYILDRYLHPVPIGVLGELHIGGVGLARGYLNRSAVTAEKFIPNPFSDEPGARLYRTGDLARYLRDGTIELIGRVDDQVKIRGFRIELGEIESVLSRHPAVRGTVVLAREDLAKEQPEIGNRESATCTELNRSIKNRKSDKRLVAYVVPAKEQSCTTSELRRFLKEKLPEYMLPSAFVFLDSLPLNPNGKSDRRALPAPDQARPELEDSYVAPRTPVEQIVAGIWAELLQLEKVGIHDNFFDLGGHSLKATQVISRLREALHVELPLRALFERPTVAQLAQRIATQTRNEREVKELALILAELAPLSEKETEHLIAKEQ